MVNQQVENFDTAVVSIFEHLRKSFPEPLYIQADSAGYSVVSKSAADGNWGEGTAIDLSSEEKHFMACVRWLEQEGYIRHSGEGFNGFDDVVLTKRTIDLLGIKPRSLDPEAYRD